MKYDSTKEKGEDSRIFAKIDSKPLLNRESSSGDLNLRVLQTLARYIKEKHGSNTLERIAQEAGLSADQFNGKSNWASHAQVELVLAKAYELLGDDATFQEACSYKFKESLGPFGFVIRALSPRKVYELGIRNHGMVSKYSKNEILDVGENHISIRFSHIHKKPDSRLMCLSRQGTMIKLPCLFGLPQAAISESSCIAKGDDACVYNIKWYEAKRWFPIAAGAAFGGSITALLVLIGHSSIPIWILLPVLGGLIGYCRELMRTAKVNMEIGEEMKEALREMAEEDAEARSEMFELHKRQKEWTGMMEEQLNERTDRIEQVLERVNNMQSSRHTALLGFSHDLRNPLGVLKMISAYFSENHSKLGKDGLEVLDLMDQTVGNMENLLSELMEMSKSETGLVKINPEPVRVDGITEQLRRRLRALVFARDIRTSVFSTREAPVVIETDLLVFNRVMDNLLTNAAKYTERGSIVIEVDGRPGFLTIKISDTGRGIAHDNIKRIFERLGSDPQKRARNSHGVGLSVVVQLMAQIGGKMEVMSKLNEGTTFWVHFPVSLPMPSKVEKEDNLHQQMPLNELVSQVVTFREFN